MFSEIESKKIRTLTFLRFSALLFGLTLFVAGVQSQDTELTAGKKIEPEPVNDNSSRFELFIRRQTYNFTPYEYTSSTQNPERDFLIRNSGLRENSKVTVPVTLLYEDLSKKLRLEVSYFEVESVNSNTVELKTGQNENTVSRRYFPSVGRSEAEINALKVFPVLRGLEIAAGGGIKNINKYIYGKNFSGNAYQEYYYTYGPQLSFRFGWNFFTNFFLNGAIDAFYAQGTRFSDNLIFDNSQIQKISSAAGERGLYRGYETDIAFLFRFLGKYKAGIGYNRIDSYFSLLNNDSINFTLTDPLNSKNQNPVRVTQGIRNGNFESLKGIYFVLSVTF